MNSVPASLTQHRVTAVQQDVTELDLESEDFPLAICAFNSLLCIPTSQGQRAALQALARHLAPEGRLVLDLINPLQIALAGDPIPKPFFTRRNPRTGNVYTRFAASDAVDEEHRQRLHGWYDELSPDGTVRRYSYSLFWRPVFRFELELMLAEAGLQPVSLEGGYRHEPQEARSPCMFVVARRI